VCALHAGVSRNTSAAVDMSRKSWGVGLLGIGVREWG